MAEDTPATRCRVRRQSWVPGCPSEVDVLLNVHHLLLALAAALAVALLGTGCAWPVMARRRRQHAALVRDAVTRMCAQRPGRPTRLCRLSRDVVDTLTRQDEGADLLDRTPSSADVDRLVDAGADAALLVTADAVTTPHSLTRREERPDEAAWQVPGRAPRVADHPELADLCVRTLRTTERRIARARLVVAQAARLGEPEDQDCRDRLCAAFDRGEVTVRAAKDIAAAGDVLAALRALTHIDLPVPEDGVPGQADVPDLRAQTNALARLALRHRAALAAYRAVRDEEKTW